MLLYKKKILRYKVLNKKIKNMLPGGWGIHGTHVQDAGVATRARSCRKRCHVDFVKKKGMKNKSHGWNSSTGVRVGRSEIERSYAP